MLYTNDTTEVVVVRPRTRIYRKKKMYRGNTCNNYLRSRLRHSHTKLSSTYLYDTDDIPDSTETAY